MPQFASESSPRVVFEAPAGLEDNLLDDLLAFHNQIMRIDGGTYAHLIRQETEDENSSIRVRINYRFEFQSRVTWDEDTRTHTIDINPMFDPAAGVNVERSAQELQNYSRNALLRQVVRASALPEINEITFRENQGEYERLARWEQRVTGLLGDSGMEYARDFLRLERENNRTVNAIELEIREIGMGSNLMMPIEADLDESFIAQAQSHRNDYYRRHPRTQQTQTTDPNSLPAQSAEAPQPGPQQRVNGVNGMNGVNGVNGMNGARYDESSRSPSPAISRRR